MGVRICMGWVILILCLAFPGLASHAQEPARDGEKKHCLSCHDTKALVKKFAEGDSISARVSGKDFDKSVHRALACTACHSEFSVERHPERSFRNKLQYRIMQSRKCRDCHPDGAIKSRAIHDGLFKREGAGEPIICTHCHSAHAVARIPAGAVSTSEEKYCLRCHSQDKKMVFASGETLSVRVETAQLRESPHRNIGCSDCHSGFSADDHPRRRFRTEREYRLSSSELCKRCHFDKYSGVSEGIHYAMISVGRLDAPTCVDCHGAHAVASLGNNRLSVVQKCKTCHSEAYALYGRSVHGSALVNTSNRDVPICIDCHSSHNIKDPSTSEFHDHIPDNCSSCHSNAALMAKYGLSTQVVKSYLSDFHGMTLSLYRKQTQKRYRPHPSLAVCTDCHGTHDITRMSGGDTREMKQRLLQRCQTCHRDASENFPDAWLSHYQASLSVAPWVFITDRFYKIMLPLILAGLLFQIVLDIWRRISNR